MCYDSFCSHSMSGGKHLGLVHAVTTDPMDFGRVVKKVGGCITWGI